MQRIKGRNQRIEDSFFDSSFANKRFLILVNYEIRPSFEFIDMLLKGNKTKSKKLRKGNMQNKIC